MDPIIISIVGALASGALVAAKGVATEAVKDAYAALKKLVVDRYHKAGPFVDEVEADPESKDMQKVLAKQLTGAEPASDVKDAAGALLAALEQAAANGPAAAVLDIEHLRALKKFEISDATFSGTLIKAKDAVFSDDVKLTGLHQTGRETDPKK